ncbi:MAG: RNA 2',3'-cyclic phosphodiesterase [Chromatiaceae bacterium]|nr:RNA 2',3'-cyclic phosphodiesterase [Chromatiaceae bacterium]MCP5421648.1 RNA 2',3'-cyclic phosphodiesterase [Chromatiaceae bacterium]
MSTARRLFFALWPDDAVRHALLHWQTHNLTHDVRWQHRDDLHLTLAFLGQVDGARVDGLRDLAAGLVAAPFALVVDEIGWWPRAQVVWAGPSSVPGELSALHARLVEGLAGKGFVPEDRPYRPHITLARKVATEPLLGPLLPLAWRVRELALVASCRGDAPHYRPLAHWPLA